MSKKVFLYQNDPFEILAYFEGSFLIRLTFLSFNRNFLNHHKEMNSKKLDEHFLFLKEKLDLFFKGRLKHLDIPFKVISGSNFEKKVWFALQEIPYGETKTYKWLAQKIGHPKSYRAVGNALCKNPLPLILPCHRVIGSNGLLRGFSGGVAIKKFLIEHEISYCDYFNLLEFP